MKRSRFSEEHIVYAIGQAESGTPVGDVCRQLGIAEQTSYAWKKKYAHLGVNELRRLRQVEKGERPAQTACGRSLARQTHAVGGLAKKRLRPTRRRELAAWFQDTFQVSCPRACRSSVGPRGIAAVERRIKGSIGAPPAYSSVRLGPPVLSLLADLGRAATRVWLVNRKRVRRFYPLDGLQLRMRVRRRKHRALHRGPAPMPTGSCERWSMDVVHQTLADGRPFRILTVVDNWSRSSPVAEARGGCPGSSSASSSIASWARRRGQVPSRLIMGPNSSRAHWKTMSLGEVSSSTSLDRANPWNMPSLNHVTGSCVTSA